MRSESHVEFVEETRAIGRPKLRYKDTCKSILKHGLVLNEWQQTFANRSLWKDLVSRVCLNINESRINRYERRREKRARELEYHEFIIYKKTNLTN